MPFLQRFEKNSLNMYAPLEIRIVRSLFLWTFFLLLLLFVCLGHEATETLSLL